MGRTGKSFNRKPPVFKQQASILVICEDKKSSLQYLKDAAKHFRVHVHVEITHDGKTDPLGIVNSAVGKRKSYDEVYCAIDRDSHMNFDEAIRLADAHENIKIIASYPCFEFWLLLHFGFNRRPYQPAGNKSAADRLISDLKTQGGMAAYAKGDVNGLFDSLLDRLDGARQTSLQVLNEAIETSEMNPSTLIHVLMDKFESLQVPELL